MVEVNAPYEGLVPPINVGPAPTEAEMEEHFTEANERLGEALVEIGMALGLPAPRTGVTWGKTEILHRISILFPEGVFGRYACTLTEKKLYVHQPDAHDAFCDGSCRRGRSQCPTQPDFPGMG